MRLLKKYKEKAYLQRLKSIVKNFNADTYLNLDLRQLKLTKREIQEELKMIY